MTGERLPDVVDVGRGDAATLGDILYDGLGAGRHVLVLDKLGHGCLHSVRRTQYMCWPPLIDKVEPVMKPASSATRNTTPRAISSALPSRPTGILATIFSSTGAGTAETMSVSV